MNTAIPEYMRGMFIATQLVGSRVTCNPPVMDTDIDILALSDEQSFEQAVQKLEIEGFQFDGSEFYANSLEEGVGFRSYRNGELNLVMTTDTDFYRRFVAASSIAKHLNLLVKADRIALFQAVLYGNEYAASSVVNCIPMEQIA